MKNRKLFPASDTTNETTACSYYCDPNCAFNYNCVPLPDINFYSPPPPPLPHQNHHSMSPYVIIFISLIITFFLCLAYYVIIYKNGGVCNSGSSSSNQQAQSDDEEDHEEFLDENRIDHPIWLIHTVGLQQSFINSITVCKYKKAEGLIEGTECSVCLNEFQEDETVRLLPKCNHAFHISCIDTWLRSHINCPMCRAHIAHQTVTAAPLAATVNQNSDNLSSLAMDNQIEHSGFDRELGQNRENCENRAGTVVIDKDNVNSRDDIQKFLQVQSMRRSVSLDSSLADTTSLVESGEFSCDQTKDADISHSHSHSAVVMKQDLNGDSSIEQCLQKGPVYMKRSFSCNGRFFVNRNLNAILPL